MAKWSKRRTKDKLKPKVTVNHSPRKPLEFKIISMNHNQLWLWKTLESV